MVRVLTHLKKELREQRLSETREAKKQKRIAKREMKEQKICRQKARSLSCATNFSPPLS